MKRFFAIMILMAFFIQSQGLTMTIEDPHNQAIHLRMLFPETTQTPFVCNQPVRFVQTVLRCDIICDKNPCESRCQPSNSTSFLVQAENCTADKIDIFSSLAWSTQVTQKSNLKFGQTWLEEFLTSADFFIVPSGAFEIEGILPQTPKILVDENGDEHTIATVEIFLNYKQTPTSPGVGFELILDPAQRGINQLLYFGSENFDDYFIKKWGLLK